MCEKVNRIFKGLTKGYVQWSVHWFMFDKHRPGLIISNNWINKTQKRLIVCPITSRDKSDLKCSEWEDTEVPFINGAGEVNYIRVLQMKMFHIDDLDDNTNAFIGTFTDEDVKMKISDIVSNLTNPMYRYERLTYQYQKNMIRNNAITHDSVQSSNTSTDISDRLTYTMNIPEVPVVESKNVSKTKPKTKVTTNKCGRKPTPFPKNWKNVYDKWKCKAITLSQACRQLKVSSYVFHSLVDRYESNLPEKTQPSGTVAPVTYPLNINGLTNIYKNIDKENIKEIMDVVAALPIFGNELISKDVSDDKIVKAMVLAISKKPSNLSDNKHKIFNNWKAMERWVTILVRYCYDHKLINDDLFIELDDFVKDKYRHQSSKENFFV